MTNSDNKTIISVCPFQTQLVIQVPVSKEAILKGVSPMPQILKVPCDKDKCELWNLCISACSVSAVPGLDESLVELTDVLRCSLGDILDTIKAIRSCLIPQLPTK